MMFMNRKTQTGRRLWRCRCVAAAVGAAIPALASRNFVRAEDVSGHPTGHAGTNARSLYVRTAQSQPSIIGKPSEMRRLFHEQVRAESERAVPVPRHVPVSEYGQLTIGCGKRVVLRVMQWNINGLCGLDGRSAQSADSVLKVLEKAEADVVLLQEAPVGPAEEWWPEPWRSTFPAKEMRELETRMKENGYKVQIRSHCPNACVLFSRLELDQAFASISLDSQHDNRDKMLEDRAARLVSLRLSNHTGTQDELQVPSISFYATHLHHDNLANGSEGVRYSEARVLLEHCSNHLKPQTCCAVIASDFNQARRRDYTSSEWDIISKGLKSVGQPGNDGVANLLTLHGWTCAYDSPSSRNWPDEGSPPFTHWTGTTVDYPYVLPVNPIAKVNVAGVYVLYTTISDHLPIVTDIEINLQPSC